MKPEPSIFFAAAPSKKAQGKTFEGLHPIFQIFLILFGGGYKFNKPSTLDMRAELAGFLFSNRQLLRRSHKPQKIKSGRYLKEAERSWELYHWTRKVVTELNEGKERPNLASKYAKIRTEKGQAKNRWWLSSSFISHRTHLLGPWKPLRWSWSHVNTFPLAMSQMKQVIFSGIFCFHRKARSVSWDSEQLSARIQS